MAAVRSTTAVVVTALLFDPYVPPPEMSFAKSVALFPPADLGSVLAAEFDRQCRVLCFGPFPTWGEVQARLEGVLVQREMEELGLGDKDLLNGC